MSEETGGIHAMLQSEACGYISRLLRDKGGVRLSDTAGLMDAFKGMRGAGYPGILVPSEYGGEGGGLQEACIVLEEIAAGEQTLALMLAHHLACAYGLAIWADEEIKRRFLPRLSATDSIGAVALSEPEAGTDLAAIKAGLESRGDSVVLNGNKCFVTNTGPGMESLVLGFFKGASGLSAVIIPSSSPGFHIAHHYRFAGWEGLPNRALVLQDCIVPRDHLIAESMQEEKFERWYGGAGLLVVAAATGMMRACAEEAIRYCGERRQHGKRLIEQQSLQFRLADIALSMELTRTSLRLAALRMDEDASCRAEASMLKLFATSRLEHAASAAVEMAGAYGYSQDSRLSALYRDAKGLQLLWGAREMLRLEIARSLGLSGDTT